MRTFGRIVLEDNNWKIEAEPHVRLKLKGLFGKVNKYQFDHITLKHSPEVARDLEWFLLRYPLEMAATDQDFLHSQSRIHQQTLIELEQISSAPVTHLNGLALPLREYQAKAREIHWRRKFLLNADELGLGKSPTAIGSLTKEGTLPALVVVQAHLQNQWKRYFTTFIPDARVHILKKSKPYPLPPYDVLICTYHKLHGWCETLSPHIRSLIFDEVQELRHDTSGKYAAAEAFRKHATYCTGLSATPIHNYGGEIWNVMNIIAPDQLGTYAEFCREWCDSQGGRQLLRDPRAFGNYLRENFLMIRRTRKEVGRELPRLETVVEPVEYTEQCLKDIDTLATELAHRILSQDTSFHEKGEAAREFDVRLRQSTGIAKAPFVAAFVKILVEEGRKVLLTGWHRTVYDIWKEHFKDAQIRSVLYTGSESAAGKEQAVREFLSDVPVMIISHGSGAGLDGLQTVCDTIVHGELAYTPAVHEQLRGRLFRDGQVHPVQEFYLVADGGSDPVLSEILGLKSDQSRGLLDPESSGLEKLTDLTSRVRIMAEAYLNKKRTS